MSMMILRKEIEIVQCIQSIFLKMNRFYAFGGQNRLENQQLIGKTGNGKLPMETSPNPTVYFLPFTATMNNH